jgi:hypothetical protein
MSWLFCTVFAWAFAYEHGRQRAKRALAEYLVLDALIANVDRHHENWGLLRKNVDGRWNGFIAPSFDHASSLGRELLDERREMLLREGRVGSYVEKGHGAVFWGGDERRGPSPLELVRRAAKAHPTAVELTNPATRTAIQIQTQDYHMIGWAPRYLLNDLMVAMARTPGVYSAFVVRVNPVPAPSKQRVLIELRGHLPAGYQPMSGREFEPLVK